MDFIKEEKYLIVSDNKYHRVLFHFKELHSELDIQIISKNQLLDQLSFALQKDPIPYLLKKEKYDYLQCKRLLSLLRIGDYASYPEYVSLSEELEQNGYLTRDSLGLLKVKKRKVLLFEDDEDFELTQFLKRKDIPCSFLHFSDIGRTPFYSSSNQPQIYEFDDKFLQFFYIFSDIRKQILSHPEIKDKIVIHLKDQNDLFYVNYFSGMFDIPCYTIMRLPLVSDEEVSSSLSQFFQDKNFDSLKEAKDGTPLFQVKNIIETYQLKELDFSFAYSCLMEILSSQNLEEVYQDRGIALTNEISFLPEEDEESLLYVSDFQHDDFYKEYDDNNLLPDAELEKIGVNPSYVKTRLDKRMKTNYILYHHIAFLSRALLHLKDKIYSSQILSELHWKSVKPEKHNPDGVYTSKAEEFLYAYYKDLHHLGSDKIYRSYDHIYTMITADTRKEIYNVTELNDYFQCPFYYYLNRVLKISNFDPVKDNLASKRGELIHGVFETIYTRDYSDFDKAYDEAFEYGRSKYVEATYKANQNNEEMSEEEKKSLTVEEEMDLRFVKKWLKDVVRTVLYQKDQKVSNITGERHEVPLRFSLQDEWNHTYQFQGRIDKIVYSKGSSGQQYYTIIDYKSGSSGSFDIHLAFLGGSLQLPLYYIALNQNQENDLLHGHTDKFGGFGIQHLFFANGIPQEGYVYGKEAIQEKTRITGIAYNDSDYVHSIDSTAFQEGGKETEKMKISGDFMDFHHSFSANTEDSSLLPEKEITYTLDDFLTDVRKGAFKDINGIVNREFKIAPVVNKASSKAREYCVYCPFKDICYHDKVEVIDIAPMIEEHFSEEMDNEAVDFLDDDDEELSNDD